MNWLEQADMQYLTPVFFAIAHLYEMESDTTITKFLDFLNAFVPMYMVAFVLVMAFVFMPQIAKTDMDIHTKRTMLLYLPPQIVARIPSIKAMVDEILATDITQVKR
jgi:hypothetical protein